MAKGKSPGLDDGVAVEFYTYFWDLIGEDFFKMISAIVKGGGMPKGVNNPLIKD